MMLAERVMLVGMVLLTLGSAAAADDLDVLFDRGCDLYDNGDFDAALEHFQALTASGVRDATVYFNVGNCHYKRGDVGMAVASYRRALMLSPRDRDTKQNLMLVRQAVGTGDTTATYSLGNLALIPLKVLSPRELQLIFYFSYYLTVLCFLGVLFLRGEIRRASIRGLVVLVIMTVGLLVLSRYSIARFSDSSEAVVTADMAQIKSGPGDAFDELAKLPDGVEVRLRGQTGLWVEVELPTGEIGWLRRADLETI